MARSRTDFHAILVSKAGSYPVYFQPPENIKMQYPCIRYQLSREDKNFADNISYHGGRLYQVIVIDKNPDSLLVDGISSIKYSMLDRCYTADGLNHWVFTIHF